MSVRQLELHQLQPKYQELRIASPAVEARLMVSLAQQGQVTPILVVPAVATASVEQYVLIDGYRRVAALRRLSRDTVSALVATMSEGEALMWDYQCKDGRSHSVLEEAWLLRELRDGHGLSLAELGRRLGHTESWISRRLAMVTVLPGSVQELVRQGELSARVAQRYLVPLARAKSDQCEQLAAGLAGKRVSTRDIGRLYEAWKRGNAAQKERIVQNPYLFLTAQAERTRDQPGRERRRERPTQVTTPACPDEELAWTLDKLAGHSRGLIELLKRRSDGVALPGAVQRAWSRAQPYLEQLHQQMDAYSHAG